MHPFLADDFHVRWSTLVPGGGRAGHPPCAGDREGGDRGDLRPGPAAATYDNDLRRAREGHRGARPRLGPAAAPRLGVRRTRRSARRSTRCCRRSPTSTPRSRSTTRLWTVLKTFGESPAPPTLDAGATKRFVEETLADFLQSGADLPPEQKERVAEIEAELSKLTKTILRARARLDQRLGTRHRRRGEARRPAGLRQGRRAANATRQGAGHRRRPGVALHAAVSLDVPGDAAPRRRRHPPPGLGGLGRRSAPRASTTTPRSSGRSSNCATRRPAILGHEHFADLTLHAPHGQGRRRPRWHSSRTSTTGSCRPSTRNTAQLCALQGGEDRPAGRRRSSRGKSPTGPRSASARSTTTSMTRSCARISRSTA